MHKTIGPFGTYVSGFFISIVLGVAAGDLMKFFFLWASGLSPAWGYIPFWLIGLPVAAECFSVGRGATVPVGYLGVPTFLGKRLDNIFGFKHIDLPFFGRYSLILSEGHHWQFPKLMSSIHVNHKIQTSDVIPVSGLSEDGIRMNGMMFYKFRVTRPFAYLDAEGEIKSLEEIGMARFRDCLADNTSDRLTLSDTKSAIAETVEHVMQRTSEGDYGIGIIKVFVPDIKLPADLEAAMDQKRVQEAKREAERILMEAFMDRLDELKARGITDPVRAAEILQNERGTLKSENRTFRVEGATEIAAALTAALKQVFGRSK